MPPISAMFTSLRHRDYRYLWLSTVFLSGGQWVQQVTVGWLIYEITGSAVLLGLLHALRSCPFLVAGPIAGVAADRMDRRKLLIMMQPLLIGATLVMGTLVISNWLEVWHIFAFTLFGATIWAFNNPIRQALVPNLVPRPDLMNAIALNSVGFNSLKVIGPALGGILIAWFGPGGNFFIECAAYTIVIMLFLQMRVPATPPHARRDSAIANFKEGFAYVWGDPLLRALLVASVLPSILVLPAVQWLLPVVQKDILHVGPDGLGLLMAGGAVGAVIATMLLAYSGHGLQRHGLILVSVIALMGASIIVFAQMTNLWLAVLTLIACGFFQMIFYTVSHTMLQVIVPDRLRGRVNSIFMAEFGLGPAGTLLAGWSIQLIGAPTTLASMGLAVIALAVLLFWGAPALWRRAS